MGKPDALFMLCLTGTVLLAAGVVFLPRHLGRSLDLRELNRVEVSERNDFSFLEQSSGDIFDAVQAFRKIEEDGANMTLVSSTEDPSQIDEALLSQAVKQIRLAFEYQMFSWSIFAEGSGGEAGKKQPEDWRFLDHLPEYARYAGCYSLTYESDDNPNKKEMLNFWHLRFTDGQNFDYSFVVSAVTYQIYYAKMHNPDVDFIAVAAEPELEDAAYDTESVYDSNAQSVGYASGIRFAQDSDERYAIDRNASLESCYMSAWGCEQYYNADKMNFIESSYFDKKLGIVILSYDSGNVYIEQAAAGASDYVKYPGVSIGLQEVAGRIGMLEKAEQKAGTTLH